MNPPQRDHEPTVPLCTVPSSQNQNHVVPLRFLPAARRACRALGVRPHGATRRCGSRADVIRRNTGRRVDEPRRGVNPQDALSSGGQV